MKHTAFYSIFQQVSIYRMYVRISALICISCALMVMWGWRIEDTELVQIRPGFAPMQFNTALCILLSGSGILLLESRYRRYVFIPAAISAALAAITASQYALNLNLGIDTLFIRPFTSPHTSHIGRMAPNTAIGLILLGGSIFLSSFNIARAPQAFSALLLAGLAAAIGLVPLLGYASGIEEAYGWEHFTRMAVHTALCLTLLSAAVMACVWKRLQGMTLWLPLPIGMGLLVITLSMAQAVRSHEDTQMRAMLKVEAEHLAQETERQMHDLHRSLQRITIRWQVAGGISEELWRADAQAYLHDYPFLALLARVDNKGNAPWIAANAGTDEWFAAFKKKYASVTQNKHSGVNNLGVIELANGKKGYALIYPLVNKSGNDDALAVVIEVNALFTYISGYAASGKNYFWVHERERNIFSTLPAEMQPSARWQQTELLKSDDTPDWTINTTPTQEMLEQQATRLPWVVLAVGGITSLLATLSLYLFLRLRAKASLLRERKARLRAVIQHAADGITLINAQGEIEEFNPACEALFGYTQAEVTGQNVKVLMPEPYHSEHDGYLAHYRKTGQKRIIGQGREVRGKRKDGSVFDIDLRVSEVKGAGRILYMGMFRDITERKRAEAQQSRLMDKLEESNAELERFAYVASHDLREPLRLVANFAMLLRKEYGETLNEEAKEYIAVINDSAARMHHMVGDLLEYARIGNEEMRYSKVSPNVEMEHVLENLASFIQEHHAVVTCDDLPEFMGNPVQIMRLFQNLVGNAIKFHAPGAAPAVHVGVEDGGEFWRFYVRDNGIGMAQEYTRQIFEPFRQLHMRDEYMGTGIGLAVCKRIVEKHRGVIWVESQLGSGSVFYFTVPR